VIIFLESFIWFLFACSELDPSAWVGENAIEVFIELALELFPSIDGVGS
jgi:hypothetical protein